MPAKKETATSKFLREPKMFSMPHDTRRPLVDTTGSNADIHPHRLTAARQVSVFGTGISIFLLHFLVYQWFQEVCHIYGDYSVGSQLLWITTAVFQTSGLVLMTIADLDMNLYVSKRKRAVLAGIVYYGRRIDRSKCSYFIPH